MCFLIEIILKNVKTIISSQKCCVKKKKLVVVLHCYYAWSFLACSLNILPKSTRQP